MSGSRFVILNLARELRAACTQQISAGKFEDCESRDVILLYLVLACRDHRLLDFWSTVIDMWIDNVWNQRHDHGKRSLEKNN